MEIVWNQPRILIDGAHNPAGIAAVASYLHGQTRPRPVLLTGATSGKPLAELFGPLGPLVDGVVVTRPPVERGLEPEHVAGEIAPLFGRTEAVSDTAAALERACELAGDGQYVLVTGSLYLVGEILGLITHQKPRPVAM